MPSIGLVLLAIVGAESGNVALAVLFAVLAGAIVAGLLVVLAQERWAVLLGRLSASVASGCAVRRIPSSGPRRSSISGYGCRPDCRASWPGRWSRWS